MNSVASSVTSQRLVSRQAKQRLIIGSTIGNALEFFDFTVFSFLMLFLGPVFFPTASEYGKLLLITATFGVGFLMRPVGGMLIGSYADRHGRRAALTLTLVLMGLGCGILAVVPSYAQIGVAAPCIVVLARLIQGFAAGGEVGASTTLLVEQAAPAQRGYYSSWQPGSQNLGVMLGALAVMGLVAWLPVQDMAEWGWRVPFVIGMLTVPVGLYVRRHLEESLILAPTLEAQQQLARQAASQQPLRMLLRHYRRQLLLSVLLLLSIVVCTQIIAFYMPSFAARELGLPTGMSLLASVLVGGIGFVLAPFVGMLADRVGRKPVILWSRLLMLLAILPCYLLLIHTPTVGNLLVVISLLSVLLVMQVVPGITMLPELFPKAVRTTGMSVAYGLGVSVFGGFAQFFVTWLIQQTASPYAPAWTMMVTVAISSLALLGIRDRTGEDMDLPTQS
ncbi:MFS transporter [Aquitalea sp.]|uniref:MFS transporter n=1 Tax=Aquitalea sp. TaxID=1872623 RepID=UPI00258FBDEB|nr:MFS transporter [Aquitalea sp.]